MPIVDTAKYPKGKNRPHGWARKPKQAKKNEPTPSVNDPESDEENRPGQRPTR